MSLVCPEVTCRKERCWDHCNNCAGRIVWRPPLLDAEIAYRGPKPLNKDGSVHRCMFSGVRRYEGTRKKYFFNDPALDNIDYNGDLYKFIKWGYPQ